MRGRSIDASVKWVIIASCNWLSHLRWKAITWTCDYVLLCGTFGTNEWKQHQSIFEKMDLKISFAAWWPPCFDLIELNVSHKQIYQQHMRKRGPKYLRYSWSNCNFLLSHVCISTLLRGKLIISYLFSIFTNIEYLTGISQTNAYISMGGSIDLYWTIMIRWTCPSKGSHLWELYPLQVRFYCLSVGLFDRNPILKGSIAFIFFYKSSIFQPVWPWNLMDDLEEL